MKFLVSVKLNGVEGVADLNRGIFRSAINRLSKVSKLVEGVKYSQSYLQFLQGMYTSQEDALREAFRNSCLEDNGEETNWQFVLQANTEQQADELCAVCFSYFISGVLHSNVELAEVDRLKVYRSLTDASSHYKITPLNVVENVVAIPFVAGA